MTNLQIVAVVALFKYAFVKLVLDRVHLLLKFKKGVDMLFTQVFVKYFSNMFYAFFSTWCS